MIDRRSVLAGLLLAGCGQRCERSTGGVSLHGAGATFPFPLYSKWIDEYHRLVPNVRVNYQPIGSGGGVRQILAGTVDFGASDVPLAPDELARVSAPVLHVPTSVGAVVVSYNVSGLGAPIRFTPELLTKIFLGDIVRWSAPDFARLNPGIALADEPITVVFRSDGSGTTALFTECLASASSEWRDKVGSAKNVRFPVGLGAKGNEGVTGILRSTPGTLSYTELAYAKQNDLPLGAIQNRAGRFVIPSVAAVTAAAESVAMPDALHVSLRDTASDAAYPLSAYTYLLVHRDNDHADKGEALARFLWWAVHEGQRFAAPLDYSPLPTPVVTKLERALGTLRVSGHPVHY